MLECSKINFILITINDDYGHHDFQNSFGMFALENMSLIQACGKGIVLI